MPSDGNAACTPDYNDAYFDRLAKVGDMQITYGRRIALRAVLDALDKGATVRQIIDACAIIEPES